MTILLATESRRFVFVGERRSNRAVSMSVTWVDGRLAAKTLHEALAAAGLEPLAQTYLNLFEDGTTVDRPDPVILYRLLVAIKRGTVVVALGQKVQKALIGASIPHLALVHPAARGRIRLRERYHAHVASVLGAEQP